jgi:8-oxo-dGTP pyrophosphatase MutT (NUDIX family)
MRRQGGNQHIPRPETWREGNPPPWPVPAPTLAVRDVVARLSDLLHADPAPTPSADPEARASSAVLVLLADGTDGAELLLTRRPWHMRTHKGEVRFPGGRLDPGETFEEAALREAHEEVGLPASEVELIGRLHPMRLVVSQTWVVPVVARIAHPIELVGHEAEVDRVFWVPLREFTLPGTYHEEHWSRLTLPDGDLHEVSILFFDLDDETVWGLTGRIVAQVLGAVHTEPPRTPPPIDV